jgi:hypothetical protein
MTETPQVMLRRLYPNVTRGFRAALTYATNRPLGTAEGLVDI